jgi:hypothetical protein
MISIWRACLGAALLFASSFAQAEALDWQPVHRGVSSEAPECVSWADDRVDCLVRTFGNGMSWVYVEAGGWNLPRNLGGDLAASPSCVSRASFALNCFAVTTRGNLATISLRGGKWSRWTSLGGDLAAGRLSCIALDASHISCYARSPSGTLMLKEWSGGQTWNAWKNVGGSIAGDPSCARAADDAVACVMRAGDGTMSVYVSRPAIGQGTWTSLGVRMRGKPSCATLQTGDVACLARATDNRSMVFWQASVTSQEPFPRARRWAARNDGEPACWSQGETLSCSWRNEGSTLVASAWNATQGPANLRELRTGDVTAARCIEAGTAGTRCLATTRNRNLLVADLSGKSMATAAAVIVEPTAAPEAEPEKQLAAVVAPSVTPRMKPAVSSRVQVAQAPASVMTDGTDRMRDLAGEWKVVDESSKQVCRIELTANRRSGGYAVQSEPACPRQYQRAEYWNESASNLVIVGSGHIVLARFLPAGQGRWRTRVAKGVSLVR